MFLRENEVIRRLVPWVRAGQTLLDIGSGTGLVSRRLARVTGVRPTLCDVVDYNRVDLPHLKLTDPLRVPAADESFDVTMMLFVLHHIESWDDQLVLFSEAARIARRRVLILEDTPYNRVDRACNVVWDYLLNVRHGVPTPFTFRSREEWSRLFSADGTRVAHLESYRPKWPTLGMYHHSLFVLDRVRAPVEGRPNAESNQPKAVDD